MKIPTRKVEILYTSEAYIADFINEYLRSRIVIETSLKAVGERWSAHDWNKCEQLVNIYNYILTNPPLYATIQTR